MEPSENRDPRDTALGLARTRNRLLLRQSGTMWCFPDLAQPVSGITGPSRERSSRNRIARVGITMGRRAASDNSACIDLLHLEAL
jgi:hypothetical protein